jgi:hypothetical protein
MEIEVFLIWKKSSHSLAVVDVSNNDFPSCCCVFVVPNNEGVTLGAELLNKEFVPDVNPVEFEPNKVELSKIEIKKKMNKLIS